METTNLPSQTALFAAAARAAHLIVDREPVIFADELAAILLGEQAEEFISYHRAARHAPGAVQRPGPGASAGAGSPRTTWPPASATA